MHTYMHAYIHTCIHLNIPLSAPLRGIHTYTWERQIAISPSGLCFATALNENRFPHSLRFRQTAPPEWFSTLPATASRTSFPSQLHSLPHLAIQRRSARPLWKDDTHKSRSVFTTEDLHHPCARLTRTGQEVIDRWQDQWLYVHRSLALVRILPVCTRGRNGRFPY